MPKLEGRRLRLKASARHIKPSRTSQLQRLGDGVKQIHPVREALRRRCEPDVVGRARRVDAAGPVDVLPGEYMRDRCGAGTDDVWR